VTGNGMKLVSRGSWQWLHGTGGHSTVEVAYDCLSALYISRGTCKEMNPQFLLETYQKRTHATPHCSCLKLHSCWLVSLSSLGSCCNTWMMWSTSPRPSQMELWTSTATLMSATCTSLPCTSACLLGWKGGWGEYMTITWKLLS